MKTVCAWCGEDLGSIPSEVRGERVVSHGLCKKCSHHLLAQQGMPLVDYLDGLGAPVLVVDGEGTVRAANQQAQELVRQDLSSIEGSRGGDVFGCIYAHLPEGCGYTMHCGACTVRRTVMETHRTGRSRTRVPAYVRQDRPGDAHQVELLVSTELVGNHVLLRVDSLDGCDLLE